MEFDLKSMCKLKTAMTCHPLSSKINCSEFYRFALMDQMNLILTWSLLDLVLVRYLP